MVEGDARSLGSVSYLSHVTFWIRCGDKFSSRRAEVLFYLMVFSLLALAALVLLAPVLALVAFFYISLLSSPGRGRWL